VFALGHLPAIDRFESFGPVGRAAEEAAGSGPIAIAGWYQGPNLLWSVDVESLSSLPEPADPALPSALALLLGPGQPRAAVVATAAWWEQVKARGQGDLAFTATLAGIREAYRDQTGRRILVVLTNAPP
jgi:hypothetical protein